MKNCYLISISMIFDLKITDDLIKNEQFIQKYQALVDNQQFLIIYMRFNNFHNQLSRTLQQCIHSTMLTDSITSAMLSS